MKRTLFIKQLSILFMVIFGLHLAVIILSMLGNYFNIFGMVMGENAQFTIRGNLFVGELNWKPMKSDFIRLLNESDAVKPIVLLGKSGFVRLDYSDYSSAFTNTNLMITLLDVIGFGIWLIVTFQLMKLITSMARNQIFKFKSIRRIRWVAMVFLIAPIISTIHQLLFSRLVLNTLEIKDHTIGMARDFKGLPIWVNRETLAGFLIMLLLLVLAEVFRHGFILQKENDLTV